MEHKGLMQQMAESMGEAQVLEAQVKECRSCEKEIRRLTLSQVVEMFDDAFEKNELGKLSDYDRIIEQLREEAEKCLK